MGHKTICIDCRKSSNLSSVVDKQELCPDCGKPTIYIPHRFRTPKKEDIKAWAIVIFLIEHGFFFQHIYESITIEKNGNLISAKQLVKYPSTMREAKEFVVLYKSQSRKR
jgi:predicted RNA-binding Zn-ribbon protein involved in translation (DUF1610 family)